MIPALWELLNYSLASLNLNKIIWGYQNAPRTEKPYAMVTYTSTRVPDHEIYGQIDEDGVRINSGWRRAIVSIHFYCGQLESHPCASRAVSLLATENSIAKQVELDVAIGHRMLLEHVPVLLNESQYEDRAIYQFAFYYTENVPDDVGRIETVIVEGNYENAATDGGSSGGAGGNITPLVCREVISTQDVFVLPVKE
jgi:hypothetical protein